jgi:hypothetical protein
MSLLKEYQNTSKKLLRKKSTSSSSQDNTPDTSLDDSLEKQTKKLRRRYSAGGNISGGGGSSSSGGGGRGKEEKVIEPNSIGADDTREELRELKKSLQQLSIDITMTQNLARQSYDKSEEVLKMVNTMVQDETNEKNATCSSCIIS